MDYFRKEYGSQREILGDAKIHSH